MPFAGTPGKLTGLFNGAVGEETPELDTTLEWARRLARPRFPDPSDLASDMWQLMGSRAAGAAVDLGKKANSAWRGYTGHNLIPTPHGIINTLLGTNYGNEPTK
jgi:hypothetical protein